MRWFWRYLKSLFQGNTFYRAGCIVLGPGLHEVDIPVKTRHLARAFVSLEEPCGGVSACVGGLNWAATRVKHNGFVLYADIKTGSCTVHYILEYSRCHGPVVIGGDL